MKKQKTEFEQLLECKDKIDAILKEYNCKIMYDDELCKVIVYDYSIG